MSDFGDLDGRFEFFAVVTPDGKIPTLADDATLNDPSSWYTGPIGTMAHLSYFALIYSDRDDADAEFDRHRSELPAGTRVRAFIVVVEEVDDEVAEEDAV